MRKGQYEQLVRNRWRRGARILLDARGGADALRRAMRAHRRRARASRVLGTMLPARWVGALRVDAFEGGVLTVAGSESGVYEWLRRQAPRLEQQLAGGIPGFRSLRVVAASRERGEGLADEGVS